MSLLKYVNSCGLNVIGCCFRSHRGFIPGPVSQKDDGLSTEQHVSLDTSFMGNECVIVKNGTRICGTGAALATADVVQDKCYFEMKVQSDGIWSVGLASLNCDLNKLPLGNDGNSWVLSYDGALRHNKVALDNIDLSVAEGDYMGCSFDHVELNFFHNGKNLHCPITKIRGTVRPVISVDDGCIIDVFFDNFVYPPPPGFSKLMVEKDLI